MKRYKEITCAIAVLVGLCLLTPYLSMIETQTDLSHGESLTITDSIQLVVTRGNQTEVPEDSTQYLPIENHFSIIPYESLPE